MGKRATKINRPPDAERGRRGGAGERAGAMLNLGVAAGLKDG